MPQSQTAALPRHQEEEETDNSKQAQIDQTYEKHSPSEVRNRNANRTEKHKNKMAQGKTYNKSPRRINHKATKSKTNTKQGKKKKQKKKKKKKKKWNKKTKQKKKKKKKNLFVWQFSLHHVKRQSYFLTSMSETAKWPFNPKAAVCLVKQIKA